MKPLCIFLLFYTNFALSAVSSSAPWVPDLGDGTYKNPVIFADYSDPDAIRVGDDYYLTSSSFNCVPGLPILHSKDLVNWRIVNHALLRLVPAEVFSKPQHGNGVWAPCLRFHDGTYYIYYGDPDYGIYVVTTTDPAGQWNEPILVKGGRGLIDPTPFWDEDGQVYLLHAWARSRSGTNNILTLHKLSSDGMRVSDPGKIIINGNLLPGYRTLEGPKFYKRDGWYYVFAPAGGVEQGWQSVFRSKEIYGPYEDRIVLAQGNTTINGPHQGALVDTIEGEWWFLHFQDREAYGRIVHLQPVTWKDGWPLIGSDPDGDGKSEPVLTHQKPDVGRGYPNEVPQTSDEFDDTNALGLQWQWQANPEGGWHSVAAKPGTLRLFAQPAVSAISLYHQPNLLLQKLPAPEFTVTTKIDFDPATIGEKAGLIIFGDSYAWIGLEQTTNGVRLRQVACRNARPDGIEREAASTEINGNSVQLRVEVRAGAKCQFRYSRDGRSFAPLGPEFTATVGRWIGSKIGLFTVSAATADARGFTDVDWFRVTGPGKD